jgi:hypothetical protein
VPKWDYGIKVLDGQEKNFVLTAEARRRRVFYNSACGTMNNQKVFLCTSAPLRLN